MRAPRGVIFDLDGTLVDSLKDIADSVNYVLAARGFPTHSLDAYRKFVGEGVRHLVARALPEEAQDELASVLQAMRTYYPLHMFDTTVPFDGVRDLLGGLAGRGVPSAVLSNKPDAAVRVMVDRLLGDVTFVEVCGQRDGVPRKPDPTPALHIASSMGLEPCEVAFVGDSDIDIETGRHAGMIPVGVLWGLRDRTELARAGAHFLAETVADLTRYLAP